MRIRSVKDLPPGTTEASVPTLEKIILDLPSKDYFLNTMDRPHYVNPVDDLGNEIKPPQQQVSEGTPSTIAASGGH